MAAATLDRNSPCLWLRSHHNAKLAAATVIPAGVMVAENASGLAVNASDTAGLVVCGRSEHPASSSASPADTNIVVGRGVFAMAGSAALIALGQAAVKNRVYVVDNQTVGLNSDSVNGVVAGILEEIDGTNFYVSLGLQDLALTTASDLAPVADSTTAGGATVSTPGIPAEFAFDIADAATADYDIVMAEKFEVTDVTVIKNAAGAGNTVQVKSTANIISDAIAAAVDKTVTRAGTIDRAFNVIPVGGKLRLSVTRAAGSGAMKVFVYGLLRP